MQSKQCTKCKRVKPLKDFYYRKLQNIYYASCKKCCNEYSKKNYQSKKKQHVIQFELNYTYAAIIWLMLVVIVVAFIVWRG
jgi:hypothetical protein